MFSKRKNVSVAFGGSVFAKKRRKSHNKRENTSLGFLVIVPFIFARLAPFCGSQAFEHSKNCKKFRSQLAADQWVASVPPERTDTGEYSLINKSLLDMVSAIQDINRMSKADSMPLPAVQALRKLGRDIALARRKRAISTSDMASRLFVSRDTLWRLERGDPTVALGTLATAIFILGLHSRLASLVAPGTDELGLDLDERRLPQRIRRPRP
jgi:DNA-binding XRE family transcriptional regulator